MKHWFKSWFISWLTCKILSFCSSEEKSIENCHTCLVFLETKCSPPRHIFFSELWTFMICQFSVCWHVSFFQHVKVHICYSRPMLTQGLMLTLSITYAFSSLLRFICLFCEVSLTIYTIYKPKASGSEWKLIWSQWKLKKYKFVSWSVISMNWNSCFSQ